MSNSVRLWVVSMAALVGMVVTASLGFWQLDRAEQKKAWVASQISQAAAPALTNAQWREANASVAAAQTFTHRRVQLTGTWMAAHVVLLDNRQMNAKPGFYVLTPLLLPSGQVALVQRGWVQRNFMQRQDIPTIETPSGLVTVYGRLAPPPSQLYSMGQMQRSQIRQNLDWLDFQEELGSPTGHLSVVQLEASPGQSDGLLREWPQVDAKLHTHYGYAAQWFALSALVAFLYLWFQWIAPRRVKQA
jgi:surfeit locus 1 family protein